MRYVVFIHEWLLASTAHHDVFQSKAENLETTECSLIQVSHRAYVKGIFVTNMDINRRLHCPSKVHKKSRSNNVTVDSWPSSRHAENEAFSSPPLRNTFHAQYYDGFAQSIARKQPSKHKRQAAILWNVSFVLAHGPLLWNACMVTSINSVYGSRDMFLWFAVTSDNSNGHVTCSQKDREAILQLLHRTAIGKDRVENTAFQSLHRFVLGSCCPATAVFPGFTVLALRKYATVFNNNEFKHSQIFGKKPTQPTWFKRKILPFLALFPCLFILPEFS
jgi:hypothetical protein